MASNSAIDQGRSAFARRQWRTAYEQLSAADGEASLEPADLERLATAAYLVGEDSRAIALWTRIHHECIDRGDVERAAYWGYRLSITQLVHDEPAQANGCLARTQRLDVRQEKGACRDTAKWSSACSRWVRANLAGAAVALADKFHDHDRMN